jgi:hypothetical protein
MSMAIHIMGTPFGFTSTSFDMHKNGDDDNMQYTENTEVITKSESLHDALCLAHQRTSMRIF